MGPGKADDWLSTECADELCEFCLAIARDCKTRTTGDLIVERGLVVFYWKLSSFSCLASARIFRTLIAGGLLVRGRSTCE